MENPENKTKIFESLDEAETLFNEVTDFFKAVFAGEVEGVTPSDKLAAAETLYGLSAGFIAAEKQRAYFESVQAEEFDGLALTEDTPSNFETVAGDAN